MVVKKIIRSLVEKQTPKGGDPNLSHKDVMVSIDGNRRGPKPETGIPKMYPTIRKWSPLEITKISSEDGHDPSQRVIEELKIEMKKKIPKNYFDGFKSFKLKDR